MLKYILLNVIVEKRGFFMKKFISIVLTCFIAFSIGTMSCFAKESEDSKYVFKKDDYGNLYVNVYANGNNKNVDDNSKGFDVTKLGLSAIIIAFVTYKFYGTVSETLETAKGYYGTVEEFSKYVNSNLQKVSVMFKHPIDFLNAQYNDFINKNSNKEVPVDASLKTEVSVSNMEQFFKDNNVKPVEDLGGTKGIMKVGALGAAGAAGGKLSNRLLATRHPLSTTIIGALGGLFTAIGVLF